MAQKILLVEDDPCFGSVLKSYLELSDYEVTLCVNGNDGLEAFRKDKFDICLLDVMMPEMDGFTLGKKIREIDGNVPFVYITAKSMKEDMKQGYEIGADDYICKPFNPLELVARVKSNLRRYTSLGSLTGENKAIYQVGGLVLNDDTKQVTVDDEPVKMTPIEYNILLLLMKNQGRVFSINQIYESIWNEDAIGADNTVAVHIRHIREKIEINPKEPRYLKVVWGVGYKIDKEQA